MRLRCSSLHRWGWVGVGVDEGVGNFPGSGWNLCNSQLLWMGFRLHCYKKVHTTFRRSVVRPAPCRQAAQGCRWGQGLQRLQVTSLPESLGFFGQKRLWKERDGFMELSVSGLWDWAGFIFNFFFTVLTRLDVAGQDWRWRLTDHLGVTTYPVCSGRSEDAICPDYCTARAPFLPQPPQRETHGRKGCSHRNKHGEKKSVGFCANNEEKKQRRTRQRNEVWADITGVLHRA